MQTPTTDNEGSGFYGLAIAPKLLAALDQMRFKTPTPIQKQAIPVACSGKDVAGIAQTGTGKTIAFGIPLIQTLAAKPGKGLVLVPTRELALQVEEVLRGFAPLMGMQTVALIGGESMGRQLKALRRSPRIIIATPGRLIDHLGQRNLKLDDVRVLVLDEADRMLDMGFAPQIERILRSVPKERQTMLFSATLPDEIMRIASAYMKLPVRVEVARSGTAAAKVVQEVFVVQKAAKNQLLQKLLDQYGGSVLLFSRTKHNAKKITSDLRNMGHSAAEIHSNRSLNQRREALEGFKSGRYRILVATDIAARGIDVTGIELVINYDLPDDYENYVHRIGRTGRAGKEGRAVSFATPDQGGDVRGIERIMKASLPIVSHPDFPAEKFSSGGPRPPSRGGYRSRPPRPQRTQGYHSNAGQEHRQHSAPAEQRPQAHPGAEHRQHNAPAEQRPQHRVTIPTHPGVKYGRPKPGGSSFDARRGARPHGGGQRHGGGQGRPGNDSRPGGFGRPQERGERVFTNNRGYEPLNLGDRPAQKPKVGFAFRNRNKSFKKH